MITTDSPLMSELVRSMKFLAFRRIRRLKRVIAIESGLDAVVKERVACLRHVEEVERLL